MSSPAAIVPNSADLFRRAIGGLLAHARDLLDRVHAARACDVTPNLPRTLARTPTTAEYRITRALGWLVALARTLAGDSTYLPPPPADPRPASPARRIRPPRPRPILSEPGVEARRAAARHRYMRHVFATRPVALIARRLARSLGATPGSDLWPTELLAILQTPAEWAASARTAPRAPDVRPGPPQRPLTDDHPAAGPGRMPATRAGVADC